MGLRVVGRAPLRWPDQVVAFGRLKPSKSGGVRLANLRDFLQHPSTACAVPLPSKEGRLRCFGGSAAVGILTTLHK